MYPRLLAAVLLSFILAHAAPPLRTGIAAEARIAPDDELVFTHPGESRAIKQGFRLLHENTYDWSESYGLTFEVRLPSPSPLPIEVDLVTATGETVTARTTVTATPDTPWSTVTLPWNAFNYERGRTSFLYQVRSVHFRAPGATNTIALRGIAAIAGARVSLAASVRGQAAGPSGAVVYPVTVGNPTAEPQSIVLLINRPGWQSFDATVEPATLQLNPGESREVDLRVTVPARVPAGGHENQVLRAIAGADGPQAATLTFTTSRAVPSPFLLHTPARWEECVKRFVISPGLANNGMKLPASPPAGRYRPSPRHPATIPTTPWDRSFSKRPKSTMS